VDDVAAGRCVADAQTGVRRLNRERQQVSSGSSLKILFSGERPARLMVARGWETLPAQSAEYVLDDVNSGLPAVHVHLSVLLSPFDPRGFGHSDIVFTSRAGRASQYPLSWWTVQTVEPRATNQTALSP
jgi:hypothetical protein